MTCFRLSHGCARALIAVVIAATAPSAYGYVAIRSASGGAEVRWPQGAQLTYRTNLTNSSGMAATDIFTIFTTSLNRWKQAAGGGFSFIYYQGTDPSKYPNQLGSPYDNAIFFTSNAGAADQLPCGVIALTEVWYDPGSGTASKADLRFNDKCFTFTTNPADTISQSRIFLGDVATHELGHSLGLDHSQNAQATMVYTAALEMSHPSCDDQAAMAHIYMPNGARLTGAISGQVLSPANSGIFGAHVQAIELERGIVMASSLSDKNGSFTINGLEPGHYGLLIEPYYPGSSTLNAYYQGISASVCNGSSFERTFAHTGSTLVSLDVEAGVSANAGAITVSCSAPASLAGGAERAFGTAPVLATAPLAAPVATQSTFSSGNDHYYRLLGQNGHLEVQALAYTLLSNVDINVELLDSAGVPLAATLSQNVFSSASSGYVDYDAAATIELATPTDVYIHVFSRGQIATNRFPSGPVGISSTPYYVLTASHGQPSPLYAANARCEAADLFPPYSSHGDAPGFNTAPPSSGSGCGTIAGDDHDPLSPGGSTRVANFALVVAALMLVWIGIRSWPGSARDQA